MKRTLEEFLKDMLDAGGIAPKFVFMASTSYGNELKEFEGIPIYYSDKMPIGHILYNDEKYLLEHKHLFAFNFSDKMN